MILYPNKKKLTSKINAIKQNCGNFKPTKRTLTTCKLDFVYIFIVFGGLAGFYQNFSEHIHIYILLNDITLTDKKYCTLSKINFTYISIYVCFFLGGGEYRYLYCVFIHDLTVLLR